MNTRIRYIDIARAIAIIIIVFGHSISHSVYCKPLYYLLYSFNIALFFILSGYTFKAKGTFFSFVKNKFKRIMIPYFIWAFIFIIPYVLFKKNIGDSLNISKSFGLFDIIINTIIGNGVNDSLKQNTSLWFLPALFSMEVIYYFIIKKTNNKNGWMYLLFVVLIDFISSKYLFFYLPWGINSVLQIGGSTFYCGYLFSKYELHKLLFKPIFCFLTLLLGFSCYLLNDATIAYVNYEYGIYWLSVCIGISFSFVVIYFSYLINHNRLLEYIGKNTMGILIFHKIVIIICQAKIEYIHTFFKINGVVFDIIFAIIVSIISILFSIVLSQILKKYIPFSIGEVSKIK